jgi:DNA primase
MKNNESTLRQHIQHLILDFRMEIVNEHMKDIQRELRNINASHRERMKELMDDFKQTQELRNALARQRGSDVIV